MRRILLVIILSAVSGLAFGKPLTPVNVQLKWDHQFQFAGFYAAISQGYYKEAGYDVNLIPRINPDGSFKDTFAELKSGRADFAVGGPDVLTLIDKGEDVVVLASYYQKSPYVYASLAANGLTDITDIHGSCISSSHDFGELELKTVFRNEGLSIDDLNIQDYRFALGSLLDGSCPVVIDYKISAAWAAREKDVKITLIEAGDYGIHFYGDTLYTLAKTVNNDPDMVNRFNQATNRGWEYALENPEEISRYIVDNYPRVLVYENPYGYNVFSARYIKELMNYPVTAVGHSNAYRWQKIQDYLYDLDVVSSRDIPNHFIFDYQKITEERQNKKYRLAIYVVLILILLVAILFYVQYKKALREKEYIREKQVLLAGSDLLRSVLDLIPVSIYWKDDRLRYLGCNQKFLDDIGAQQLADVVGRTDYDMPWHEKGKYIRAQDRKVLSGEFSDQSYEERIDSKNGLGYWLRSKKIPLKDQSGNVLGVLGSYQDITEYKSIIDELNDKNTLINQSNQKLSLLIDNSPDVIVYREFTDSGLQVLVSNYLFKHWAGINDEKDINEIPGYVNQVLEDKDNLVVSEMNRINYQAESNYSDGRKVLLDIAKVPVVDAQKNVKGILFVARDVTEAYELQSLYEALFSLTQDPFFVIDEYGSVSSCNDAAAKQLGLENRNNLIGMKLIEHFSPQFQPSGERTSDIVERVNEEIANSESVRITEDFTHQDINGVEFRVRVFIVRLNAGPKRRLLVQWHDIEDMYAREKALRQAKQDAEDLAKEKSMFLANMSHEIRTPLNALVGLSTLLAKNENHSKQEEYIKSINRASVHLKSIVDDILDFSKIDAEHIELDEIAVDMNMIVDEMRSLHESTAKEKGLEFTLENRLRPDRKVLIDPVRFRQIANNLISNAIKFTQDGEVHLLLEEYQGRMLLSVCDTGCGIDQSQLANLFVPFSQADVTTTRKYGGTGLGLSICKGLVELMQGDISVESELEKGTCFKVTIPLHYVEQGDTEEPLIEVPDLSGKRILVVEDNAMNQLVIEGLLEDSHCQCSFASNGEQAIEVVKANASPFDLVLMDLQMPVMDGYQATDALLRLKGFSTPIVALTANASEVDRDRCRAIGMQGFLTKPIDQYHLYEMINRVIA